VPLPFPLLPLLPPLLSQLLLGLELLILVRVPRPTFLYCLLPTDAHRLLQNQLNLLMDKLDQQTRLNQLLHQLLHQRQNHRLLVVDKLEGMRAMGMYLDILMLGMGMDQLLRLHNQQCRATGSRSRSSSDAGDS
jgi:hypothetical protein